MQAWDNFVKSQEVELGADTVRMWLKTLKMLRFDAGNLYLEANDTFQAMWFEEHIRQKVKSTLVNNNKKPIKVHLSIANEPVKTKSRVAKALLNPESSRPAFNLTFDELDPSCTFASFVAAEHNLLTHKVLTQIAGVQANKQSGDLALGALNPVYVHGGTGSGKSHLLMATASALRGQGYHVVYARAHSFTDHVVSAIRAGEMSLFRQAYRNSDVLIIDDVHVFSRKGATQEEFFHTFNTLQVAGKQIILSANCSPAELQLIEPRLVSRFEWGIVLNLEMPSRADCEKVLLAKAQVLQFPLQAKVVEFLLDSFSTTKALSKALEALVLRSHLNKSKGKSAQPHLTVQLAHQLLGDLLVEEKQAALTPQRIISGVAEFFGIRSEDIIGKAQTRDCVLPRQISMHLCRYQLKLPFVRIGEIFSKDHSTVMSSVKLIQKGIEADDPEIVVPYRVIFKKISLNTLSES